MNSRRWFLGSLTGMLGIGATAKAVEPEPVELEPIKRTLTEDDLRMIAEVVKASQFPGMGMMSRCSTCWMLGTCEHYPYGHSGNIDYPTLMTGKITG